MRLANAIFHTYKVDEYKELDREIPMKRVCELFGKPCNEESIHYIAELINEILDEPVAVINKVLHHKHIEWQTYDFFTILQPIELSGELIKLRINPEYLTITKAFVANPYLEF